MLLLVLVNDQTRYETRMGQLEVSEATHAELMVYAEEGGNLALKTNEELSASIRKVSKILTLIAASRDYQFA